MSVWGDPVMIGSGGGVSAADNGKVVVSGALVAQTARAITANGTYDTTTNDSVTVNVPTNIGKNLLYLSRYGSPTVWTGGSLRVTESESNDTSVVTVSGTATQYDGATWTVPFNVTQLFQGCKLSGGNDQQLWVVYRPGQCIHHVLCGKNIRYAARH